MRGRGLHFAVALTLFAVPPLTACSPNRAVATSGNPPGVPKTDNAQAGEPVTGRKVTKDVPHSAETIRDIKEREAKEPLPPRGDMAIPSHRIRGADNAAVLAPPGGPPAGTGNPAGAPHPGTGGNR